MVPWCFGEMISRNVLCGQQDHTVFGEATPFAYSCLTEVADESKIGVLWETGMEGCKGPSCRSVFSTVAK